MNCKDTNEDLESVIIDEKIMVSNEDCIYIKNLILGF
jgi:hypothetical protein